MTACKDAHEAARQRAAPRCPVCGRPRMDRWRPFCSKRCADVDLGRWLGEVYRIPAVEAADEDDDARAMGPEET
ncbi:DNA gyrase inhibitor YacG (modular protein) [Candidatus Defluviicoccus seviourii]|uniref:DNA gyrase inhibitor YacG n=1 Tax=Candidatus Defluviicoccus seviourii TaxID=2565273 RepID=A0A564WBV3_9PROT|nr:DNA gyrase inhibitor YacG (modular protein) [Candidatus Defluviicoccus seviourii]